MAYYEDPNPESQTYGVELTIESAREDIVTAIHVLGTIYLFVEGCGIWAWLALVWTILQFILALKKEMQLRAWRMNSKMLPKSESDSK